MSNRFDILRSKFKISKINTQKIDNQDIVENEIKVYNSNLLEKQLEDLDLLLDFLKKKEDILKKYFTKKQEIKTYLEKNSITIQKNKKKLDDLQKQISSITVSNVELEKLYNFDKNSSKELETLTTLRNINKNLNLLNHFLINTGILDKKYIN